jgi:hypothetical protein
LAELQIPSGWWYTYPSEKYKLVSWDDSSQYMEKEQMFQTTNQIIYSNYIPIMLRESSVNPIESPRPNFSNSVCCFMIKDPLDANEILILSSIFPRNGI